MKTHRVLNRLSKCADVHYRKKQVLLWFTINSQSKLKKSVYYSWDIYQEKLATKFNNVSWRVFWVGDPRKFHESFFVKNYYLNLNFFQALQSALLKNKIKSLLKKGASHLKISWQLTSREAEIKHLKKRKKTKNEK